MDGLKRKEKSFPERSRGRSLERRSNEDAGVWPAETRGGGETTSGETSWEVEDGRLVFTGVDRLGGGETRADSWLERDL